MSIKSIRYLFKMRNDVRNFYLPNFNEILERINLIKNISKSNNVYLNIDFVNEFENFIFEFKDAKNLHI